MAYQYLYQVHDLTVAFSHKIIYSKKEQEKEITKLESEHAAAECINATKLDTMKQKLVKQDNRIPDQREKWQGKGDKLSKQLDQLSGKVYNQKRQGQRIIQYQIEKATENETEMQSYINDLQEKDQTNK